MAEYQFGPSAAEQLQSGIRQQNNKPTKLGRRPEDQTQENRAKVMVLLSWANTGGVGIATPLIWSDQNNTFVASAGKPSDADTYPVIPLSGEQSRLSPGTIITAEETDAGFIGVQNQQIIYVEDAVEPFGIVEVTHADYFDPPSDWSLAGVFNKTVGNRPFAWHGRKPTGDKLARRTYAFLGARLGGSGSHGVYLCYFRTPQWVLCDAAPRTGELWGPKADSHKLTKRPIQSEEFHFMHQLDAEILLTDADVEGSCDCNVDEVTAYGNPYTETTAFGWIVGDREEQEDGSWMAYLLPVNRMQATINSRSNAAEKPYDFNFEEDELPVDYEAYHVYQLRVI